MMRGQRWATELAIAAGFAGIALGCSVAALLFPPQSQTERLMVVAMAVFLVSALARNMIAALATGAMAWPFLNGFLVNTAGQLAWHGNDDLIRVATLISAAVFGAMIGRSNAAHHQAQARPSTHLTSIDRSQHTTSYDTAPPYGSEVPQSNQPVTVQRPQHPPSQSG
ncbi:hypothetical protein [Nonomuraea sp. CA-141351]|uniref:hypothetical protein n=1 Tax=Nonomuraea sp. CA-141351 TaxID=3239996 RepID=UPI003D9277B6